MGVSFEKEYENLDNRGIKSLNSIGEKKRNASSQSKKFKTFNKQEKSDDAFEFLRKYSKNEREDDLEDESRESVKRNKSRNAGAESCHRSKREDGEYRSRNNEDSRPRKSDSDHRLKKGDYKSKNSENRPKRLQDEDEDSNDEENDFRSRKEEGEVRRRGEDGRRNDEYRSSDKDEYRSRNKDFKTNDEESSDESRPRTAERRPRTTGGVDRAKYLDIHRGSGENPLEELLQIGSQNVLSKRDDGKRDTSGWNVSDNDWEEYMKAKNYYKKKDVEEEEGFSLNRPGFYLGAASLLAAGVTMAYVKTKFFS